MSDEKAVRDPVARALAVGYTADEVRAVPAESVMGMGCGNPTALAGLREGEAVLDLGCGGGFDVFLASRRVGPAGRVIGVDKDAALIEKARESARRGGYANVEFRVGRLEDLPVEDGSADVILSNCVVNDCADKLVACREAYRVLRPGGRLLIADLVIESGLPPDAGRGTVWAPWLAGALQRGDYLSAFRQAGFADVSVVSERPYESPGMDARIVGKVVALVVSATRK